MSGATNTVIVSGLAIETVETTMWAGLETILDPAEKRQAEKFVFDSDRRAYVAAHALLRYTLSTRARVEPAAWRFALGPFGKPFLEQQPNGLDLRFSLSHTRSMVVVALAQGVEVGVDVEARERAARLDLDIADAFFASGESALLRALPGASRQQERFLTLWTLKEAVIKATGRGLSQSLKSFNIGFDPLRLAPGDVREEPLDDPESWRVAHWLVRDHHVAVAAQSPEVRLEFEYREAELPRV